MIQWPISTRASVAAILSPGAPLSVKIALTRSVRERKKMSEYMILHGAEDVKDAASRMQEASSAMIRAADTIHRALELHQTFLTDHEEEKGRTREVEEGRKVMTRARSAKGEQV